MAKTSNHSLLIFIAFISIYIIWGTTYLAILFGLESFPPFMLSGFRFGSAGLILLVYCLSKGEKIPKGKSLRITVISGIIMLVGGSGLVAWSEQYILSGHVAVVVATEPFIFLILDRSRWTFYFSKRNIIAGLVTGFVGVVLFVFVSSSHESSTVSSGEVIIGYSVLFFSCVLWVAGTLYAHSNKSDSSNTMISAVQLVAAGIFSMILATVTGEWNSFSIAEVTFNAWCGLIYLIFFGSIVAYLSFNWLITVRPAAQVSTHTYVNPVVAIFIGWLVAHEPVSILQIASIAIILIGVLLTNRVRESDGIQTE